MHLRQNAGNAPCPAQNLATGQVRRNLTQKRESAARANQPGNGGKTMAKQCLIIKQKAKPKFKVRAYTRCSQCGRDSGYMRYFGVCRICFREMSHKGLLPGVVKSSW